MMAPPNKALQVRLMLMNVTLSASVPSFPGAKAEGFPSMALPDHNTCRSPCSNAMDGPKSNHALENGRSQAPPRSPARAVQRGRRASQIA